VCPDAEAAAAALKYSNRIRPIDIIRVPLYERVWEVGAMGQVRRLLQYATVWALFLLHLMIVINMHIVLISVVIIFPITRRSRRPSAWTSSAMSGRASSSRSEHNQVQRQHKQSLHYYTVQGVNSV